MSRSSSESEKEVEVSYFGSQNDKLVNLCFYNLSEHSTLEELKPLLDEVIAFLESANDHGVKEVEHALEVLNIAPQCLMVDRRSLWNSLVNWDINQLVPRQHEVGQYLIRQGYPSTAVKVLKSLQGKLSCLHTSDQHEDQCETNIQELFEMFHTYTGTYPMHTAPFCRSICKEGALEIFAESLLHIDDPDGNMLHKTLKRKREILITLFNIIIECPDYRDKYRRVNIVNALSKAQTTDEEIKRLSLLILAYIVDETENDLIVKSQDSVQFLTKLFTTSAYSVKHMVDSSNFGEAIGQEMYNCRELLGVLNHLAVHDANKEAIVKHGGLPAIIRMLQSDFSEDERRLAAEALCNLALKDGIKKNPEMQKAKSSKEERFFFYIL